jgi:flagellar motor switch protein FliG
MNSQDDAMTVQSVHDLSDSDARRVSMKMVEILKLSEELAGEGSARGFRMYKLSRDILEVLTFDQVSRTTMAKLMDNTSEFQGHEVHADVLSYMKSGQKINAIKRMRELSGMGLKEAKDWVEAYQDQVLHDNW